jgi:hypothetical protein
VNVRGEFADVEKLEPPVPPTPRRRRAVAAEAPAEPLELEDEDEEHEEEEAPRGCGSFWSAGALSFKRKGRR